MQYSYPVQDPVSAATTGVIPVELLQAELGIEGLYESPGRQRGDNWGDKVIPAHVHSVRNRYRHYIKRQLTVTPASTGPESCVSEGVPREERETQERDGG